jgi:hypothetical protein
MAIDVPTGYVTRPTAAKLYYRSQRSLERDLEEAYKQHNLEVLSAFKLVTNDQPPRNAIDVTTEMVESLKQNGNNPAWCISKSWLQQTFGERGSPRPKQRHKHSSTPDTQNVTEKEVKAATETTRAAESTGVSALPNDVDFLQERIRTLEREKQQEIDRNREREAKLFEQLEVKDKQISAWDEITQGITKGLATGKLAPALSAALPTTTTQTNSTGPADVTEVPTSQVIDTDVDNARRSKPTKQGSGRRSQQPRRKKTATKKTASRRAQPRKRKAAGSTAKTKSAKQGASTTASTPKTAPPKRGFLSRLFSS